MKYVFLDTCVIVDCAFTRKEKSSPKLLERLMERLRENGSVEKVGVAPDPK